jgi:hypothetical protein
MTPLLREHVIMAARSRSRTTSTVLAGGYRIYLISTNQTIGTNSGASGISGRETCADVTMLPPFTVDHTFVCIKYRATPLRLYGYMPYAVNGYEYEFQGYNPPNRSLNQYCPTITPINWTYWKTKALANLNPNAPVVDVPLFLFEFKDFPAMLRNMGDILGKRIKPDAIPGGYLAYSFGWKPLVADLLALFNIQESISKRLAYLKRLEHGGRVRRSLGGGVVQHSILPDGYSSVTSGSKTAFKADIEFLETQKVWFTANAKLLDPLPLLLTEQRSLAKDIVLGLNVDPSTLWNMIPWSWLIDYFLNLGDVMQAYRGGLRFSTTRMCIMATSDYRNNLINARPYSSVFAQGGNLRTIAKQRSVFANPRPQLTWDPILSGTQILNLGALVTAKALQKVL